MNDYEFIQDIRYALRQLRKTPGFTITAVLTLALGIGGECRDLHACAPVMLKSLPLLSPTSYGEIGDKNSLLQLGRLHPGPTLGIFAVLGGGL